MVEAANSEDRRTEAAAQAAIPATLGGYQKLRAPQRHGQTLQVPALASLDQIWNSNLQVQSATAEQEIEGSSLAELRRSGRAEIVGLASRYSRQYLDDGSAPKFERVVMAGHQPELYHPGVWYKNFVLSKVAERVNAVAINLVVDNDICGTSSIRYPEQDLADRSPQGVRIGTVPLDQPGPTIPFENRFVNDYQEFGQFADRVCAAMEGIVDAPIVERLWKHVIEAGHRIDTNRIRLGHAVAAGRHRLEFESGLRTLEVPISWMAKTDAFARFVKSVLVNAHEFQICHNETLKEYRESQGIRSRSHPVPELESREGWTEVPFWVWNQEQPHRRRLFTRQSDSEISISDLAGWEATLETANWVLQFQQLGSHGIAIRPRALMTTLFSRLVLCDLFLHGIGGAKYDQLTDVIASRFFSVPLPGYMTLTATMKLPTEFDIVKPADVVKINQQLRELKFHPERHLKEPDKVTSALIQRKLDWISGERQGERSRRKHDAIESVNEQLASYVTDQRQTLLSARESVEARLRASQILDSREYSFCLFPESLVDELKSLAQFE